MMKQKLFAFVMAFMAVGYMSGQTLDTSALQGVHPSVARQVHQVSRYVKLDATQQVRLAQAFESEDSLFFARIKAENDYLGVKSQRELQRIHDAAIARILTDDQLQQYYRGVYDAEADAEGIEVANRLQKKYNLTDQNWKFIRIAFYKIGLESRVINKIMADKPAKAKKEIDKLRSEMLATIEAKGDIRVNPEGTTVEVLKPFDPNTLHK